jgi:hypothetical protein
MAIKIKQLTGGKVTSLVSYDGIPVHRTPDTSASLGTTYYANFEDVASSVIATDAGLTSAKTKTALITVTQAVDLDTIESSLYNLLNELGEAGKKGFGGAILNGTSQYYSHIDNANLNFGTDDFSISAMFEYRPNATTEDALIRKASTTGMRFVVSPNGDLQYILNKSDGNSISLTLDSSEHGMVVGNVYAIDITRSGDTVKVYINNTLKKTATGFAIGIASSTATLKIGYGESTSRFIKGNIYYIRFYNYALTQAEITSHWNNGLPHLFQEPYAAKDANNINVMVEPAKDSYFTDGISTNWSSVGGATVGVDDATDTLQIVSTSVAQQASLLESNVFLSTATKINKKFRVTVKAKVLSGTAVMALRFPFETVEYGTSETVTVSLTTTEQTFTWERTYKAIENALIYPTTANTIIISEYSITPVGNTFSVNHQDFGTNGAKCKLGDAISVLNGTANPIAVSKNWDGRQGVSTTEVVMTNSQPANTNIKGFWVIEKGGVANTVSIGLSSGSYTIASAVPVTANSTKFIEVNELSLTARTFYVIAGASSLIIIPEYKEM